LVIYSMKNSVIPLPQAVTTLSDKPLGSWGAWVGCEVVDGNANPCLHLGRQTQVAS
jgi:hypothetical protein